MWNEREMLYECMSDDKRDHSQFSPASIQNNPEWFLLEEKVKVVISRLQVLRYEDFPSKHRWYQFRSNQPLVVRADHIEKAIEFVANGTSNSVMECIEKVHGKKWTDEDMARFFKAGRDVIAVGETGFEYRYTSFEDFLFKTTK